MTKTASKKRRHRLLQQAGWVRKMMEEEGLVLHQLENDRIWRFGAFEADRLYFRCENGALEIGLTVENSAGMSAHLTISYYIARLGDARNGSWSINWECERHAPVKFQWLLKNNGFDPSAALRGGLPGRERKEWPTEPKIERLLRDCARFLLNKPLLKTSPPPERSSHACEG